MTTDVLTVFSRELRPTLRQPFTIIISMVQPLVFLGLFAPLLPKVEGTSPLQWFVPGIVVMSALFASSMTGSNLLLEQQTGSHERMLVTPLRRSALLVGRALKEIVPMVAQAALIVAVCVGLGALSYSLALASKNQDWLFWTVQQTLLFPILLLAGMLLPIDGGPGWLRTAARFNPLTYVVDAERALFNGDIWATTTVTGALAAAGVCALGLFVGVRAMRRDA
jgi:ABC-2 type transport system permease protein